jgi:acetyl-CoA carboxylase biotin carboxyl carrier protein
LKLEDLNKLLDKLEQMNFSEVELEIDQTKIHVKKGFDATTKQMVSVKPEQSQRDVTSDEFVIKSPMVGIVHFETPLKNGQKVRAGDVVAQIESMKLFNDVTSPRGGLIDDVRVQDGDSVEFDQPLLSIKKDK